MVTIGSYLIGNQQTFNPLRRLITSPNLTRSNLLLIVPTAPLITSLSSTCIFKSISRHTNFDFMSHEFTGTLPVNYINMRCVSLELELEQTNKPTNNNASEARIAFQISSGMHAYLGFTIYVPECGHDILSTSACHTTACSFVFADFSPSFMLNISPPKWQRQVKRPLTIVRA